MSKSYIAVDITNTPILVMVNSPDRPSWGGKGSGNFTISKCYDEIIVKNKCVSNNLNWKWLWKMKLPNKIIHFLWLVRHHKILSNAECLKRGIRNNDHCRFCGMREDVNHIFHECSKANQVWNLVSPSFAQNSGDIPFIIWFDANLKDTMKMNVDGLNWNMYFATVIWNIWKARNDLEFNDKLLSHNQISLKSLKYVEYIYKAFKSKLVERANFQNSQLIKWNSPDAGTIKINMDGSTSNKFNYASIGCLARSSQGKWIEGFCGFIGSASPLKAELWAIRHALKLCKEKGWFGAAIETDCLVAVDLINHDGNYEEENHQERVLIQDCMKLKMEMGTPIRHIPREANQCADKLAKIGGTQKEQLVRLMVPPNQVIKDLIEDMEGEGIPRGAYSVCFCFSIY